MRLAIVGSTRFTDPDAPRLATELIIHKIRLFTPEVIISGGAKGVDSIAETIARQFGYDPEIHLPKSNRWAPYGYEERNRIIADRCTHLLALRDCGSKSNGWMETSAHGTYGSGWTADEAERLGKVVERIVL